jgi:hypothetical protein
MVRSWLTPIGGQRKNGELRAHQAAKLAVYTGGFFFGDDFWKVVALGIGLIGDLQNLTRAEVHTQLAAFTSFRDQVDLAAWRR